jgi:nucleoid-associated protein YgaU
MAKSFSKNTGNGFKSQSSVARRMDLGTRRLGILSVALALAFAPACTTSGMQGSEEEDAAFSDEVPVEDAATDEVALEEGNVENPEPVADGDSPPSEEPVADVEAESVPRTDPAVTPTPVAEVTPPVESTVNSVPPPSSGIASDEYVVATGDTLMKIAFKRYGDVFQWKKIANDNADKLKNPNVLPVGMKIKVEPSTFAETTADGERYLIKQGDTLGSISGSVYGTPRKWKKIWENNKELIKNPNRIFSGFYISYIFSDQDRQEKESFESGAKSEGSTLGGGASGGPASRNPASAPAPASK